MEIKCPITKILLPIDGSERSMSALEFAGRLGAVIGEGLTGITLLHVTAGGYLSRHMSNVDFRTEILKESDTFKRIRNEYIKKDIMPFMNDAEKKIKELGVECSIEKTVLDGDPVSEIAKEAEKGGCSAIVMARRGLSELKGLLIGSVTSGVIHRSRKQVVYVVGKKVPKGRCPIPNILIPLDGSSYSMKGIEHTACLTAGFKDALKKITLLRVINLALYEERISKGLHPEEEAERLLVEAKKVFLKAGFSEGLISVKSRAGNPAEEIAKEADEEDISLIVMGRKGRGALKDFVMGGVSSYVLQRSTKPTIALISG